MKEKKETEKSNNLNRRDFIKLGATAGVGVVVAGLAVQGCKADYMKSLSTKPGLPKIDPIDKVRIGFVGVGN